jgi:hypothetical protein
MQSRFRRFCMRFQQLARQATMCSCPVARTASGNGRLTAQAPATIPIRLPLAMTAKGLPYYCSPYMHLGNSMEELFTSSSLLRKSAKYIAPSTTAYPITR